MLRNVSNLIGRRYQSLPLASEKTRRRYLARLTLREREKELAKEIRTLEQALETNIKVEDVKGDEPSTLTEEDYKGLWLELTKSDEHDAHNGKYLPDSKGPEALTEPVLSADATPPSRHLQPLNSAESYAVRVESSSGIPGITNDQVDHRDLDKAIDQLKILTSQGHVLPIKQVHLLLRRCLHRGSMQSAQIVFRSCFAADKSRVLRGRMGLAPSIETWEIMVKTALRTKSAREGWEIFAMLHSQEHIKPSLAIWATMIRVCGLSTNQFGADPERALEMYDLALKSLMGSSIPSQHSQLVAALISALSSTPETTKKYLVDILNILQRDKALLLDAKVANELLRACAKIGDLQRVRLIVNQVLQSEQMLSAGQVRECLRILFWAYASSDAEGMLSTGQAAIGHGEASSVIAEDGQLTLLSLDEYLRTHQQILNEASRVFYKYRHIFHISDINAYLSVYARHATPPPWWEVYTSETRSLPREAVDQDSKMRSDVLPIRNGHTYRIAMDVACIDRTPPILERARSVFEEWCTWQSVIADERDRKANTQHTRSDADMDGGSDDVAIIKDMYCKFAHLLARHGARSESRQVILEYLRIPVRQSLALGQDDHKLEFKDVQGVWKAAIESEDNAMRDWLVQILDKKKITSR